MQSYLLISPEIAIVITALLVLFADIVPSRDHRVGAWLGAFGALVTGVLALVAGRGDVTLFGRMMVIDGPAQFTRIATGLLTALFLLWMAGRGMGRGRVTFASALTLLSALGCLLLASAHDWVVLYLAIETATMPLYVLIGFDRDDDRAMEGALKYFLLSMITSLGMLYGLSFIVGLSGDTAYSAVNLPPNSMIAVFAAVLVTGGLLMKLSAAPFQWWAPDAYAGASAGAVAFVSSVPKIAGVVALFRVIQILGAPVPVVFAITGAAAVGSVILGNLAAYPQTDMRRLMAYSGIAHAGYLLIAITAGTVAGYRASVFYALAYAIPSMAVMFIAGDEGCQVSDMAGLAKRRPWVAWTMLLLLLSLIGVPPMIGFLGKVYVFAAVVNGPLVWLAVLGVTMSVVSAGFYFRIIRAMFFQERDGELPSVAGRNVAGDLAYLIAVVLTVALGIWASPLLDMIGTSL